MKKHILLLLTVFSTSFLLKAQLTLENHLPPIGSSYVLSKVTSKLDKAAKGGYQTWDYSAATTSAMYTYNIIGKASVNQSIKDSFPDADYIEMLSIGAPDINLNPMVFYKDMGTYIKRLGDKGSGSSISRINDTLMLFDHAYESTIYYAKNYTTYSGYGQLKIKGKTFDSVAMITYTRAPFTDTVVSFVQLKPYYHRIFAYNLSADTVGTAYYYDPSGPPSSGISYNDNEGGVSIYPNPANEMVNINVNDQSDIQQISIFDITGKCVVSQLANQPNFAQVSVKHLNKGLYVTVVQTSSGTSTKKLIIE